MFRYLGKSFLLIAITVVIMCGAYPLSCGASARRCFRSK